MNTNVVRVGLWTYLKTEQGYDLLVNIRNITLFLIAVVYLLIDDYWATYCSEMNSLKAILIFYGLMAGALILLCSKCITKVVIAVFRKMYSLYVAYRHTFCGEAMPTQLTINIMNTKSRRSIEEYNKKVIVSIVVFRIIAITLYSILCLVNAYMGSDNFIVLFIMNPIYVLLIVAVNNSTCYTLMNEIFGV